jgi:3-deoxy-D-manno-octulosonate 8-phosphate phosphatase (KDO 8-P phosphatase)
MNTLEQFKHIKTFIFDVDGVLTDGNLQVTEAGELLRTMNSKDGYAMRLAIDKGFRICIITGGKSKGVVSRLLGLGIEDVYSGIHDKVTQFDEYVDIHDLNPDEILYMGDDMPDFKVLQMVGLPTCPMDAVPDIQKVCSYISPYKGGAGCVRDVIEKVLKLNNLWE